MSQSAEYTGTPESIEAIQAIRKKGFTVKGGVLHYEKEPVLLGTVFTLDGKTFSAQEPFK